MRVVAQVLTSWRVEGGRNHYALPVPLPVGAGAQDVTGEDARTVLEPPNSVVVEIRSEETYVLQLEAAEPGCVLWMQTDEPE